VQRCAQVCGERQLGGSRTVVDGGPGADRIVIDRAGRNVVYGGTGIDTIDFRRAPAAVRVNLQSNSYSDAVGTGAIGHTLDQVENVIGSGFDDYLTGDSQRNRLLGMGGDDTLRGSGGSDRLDGGDGWDVLDGGLGLDNCTAGEVLSGCSP